MVNLFILALRSSNAKLTGANEATEMDAVSAILKIEQVKVVGDRLGGGCASISGLFTKSNA